LEEQAVGLLDVGALVKEEILLGLVVLIEEFVLEDETVHAESVVESEVVGL
jgi:hypothetical protein